MTRALEVLTWILDNWDALAVVVPAVAFLIWKVLRLLGAVQMSWEEAAAYSQTRTKVLVGELREARIREAVTMVVQIAEHWGQKEGWNGEEKLRRFRESLESFLKADGIELDDQEREKVRVLVDGAIAAQASGTPPAPSPRQVVRPAAGGDHG